MTALTQAHCGVCRAGAPHVSNEEPPMPLQQVPGWDIGVRDGIIRLERVCLFRNFKHALASTNTVGKIPEAEDHRPGLLTGQGKITVTWWSHLIRDLRRNDFIMTVHIDEVAKTTGGHK